jgi:integrase
MTPQLAGVLKLWRKESNYTKEDDLIFASEVMKGEQPRTGCTISQKIIRPAAERLGIIDKDCPRFGMHNLRHSLATFLAEQGTEPEVIQRILRHSTLPMAMRYTHLRKLSRAAQSAFLKKFGKRER